MDILLSEVIRKIFVPVACPIHNNVTRLRQRTRRTLCASFDRKLIRWKDSINWLIDKGDFHINLLGYRAGASADGDPYPAFLVFNQLMYRKAGAEVRGGRQ